MNTTNETTRNEAHTEPPALPVEAMAIDARIASDGKCAECGGAMHYRSQRTPGGGYRALAVCQDCDNVIEF
jgi:hypothetical protein